MAVEWGRTKIAKGIKIMSLFQSASASRKCFTQYDTQGNVRVRVYKSVQGTTHLNSFVTDKRKI